MYLEKIDVVKLSKIVLAHLSIMDYEQHRGYSSVQLIFPMKIQANGTKHKDRISEQELRLLFIEEFKEIYKEFFYSIETPTIFKHSFGKLYEDIKSDGSGQSASIDMCIFKRVSDRYHRILNIEFKSKNPQIKGIGKDVLKLIAEEHNGAFIHLLDNSNKGTLCNVNETGVFNKFHQSFSRFQENWVNEHKSIQLIIISLKQKIIIHRKIKKSDLKNLKSIFFIESGCGNIEDVKGNGWMTETIIKE